MILCGRFFFGCFFPPGFLKVALKKGGLEKMVVFKILPPNNVATESYHKWRKGISLCKVLAVSLPNIFSQV